MTMWNVALMLGSIMLFGVSAFLRKMSVDRIHPYQLQVIAGLVYAVELPIWLWLIRRDPAMSGYTRMGVLYGIGCIIAHVLGAVAMGTLMKSTNSPGAVATMVAMNPVVTCLLTWAILGEEFTTRKVIATIITLIGVAMFTL